MLCVDDEPMYISTLAAMLELKDDRFTLATANNVPDAMSALRTMDVDCVIADYHMPGRDGVDFAASVQDLQDPPPVIILTGREMSELRERVEGTDVYGCFFKGSDTVYDDVASAVVEATAGAEA